MTVVQTKSGPNLLVRFIWWLFIGSWASGIAVVLAWIARGVWFILIGWWLSGVWMVLAWLVQLTIIGIPIALPMFNRTPFIASFYRY
jgi:hypothetical protein